MTIEDPTFEQLEGLKASMSKYHPVCEECLAEIGFESEDLCIGFSSANCETCGCQRSRRDLVCLDTESFRRYQHERRYTALLSYEQAAKKMADAMQQKVWAAEYDPGSDAGDATAYAYATPRSVTQVVQETIPTSETLETLIKRMKEVPAVQTGAYFLPDPAFGTFIGQIKREPISFDLPEPEKPYKFVYPFDYGVKVYRMPSALLMPCDTGSPVVDDCEEKPRPVRQERPAPAHQPMWQNVVLAAVAALVMCMLVQALEM